MVAKKKHPVIHKCVHFLSVPVLAWLERECCGDWWCGNWCEHGDRCPSGSGAVDGTAAELDMSLFSRRATYVQFTGEESCMRWEDYLFELQMAEWKAAMPRGADERTRMNSMAILLDTCESLSNQEIVDQGVVWITQGTEQDCNQPLQVLALTTLTLTTPVPLTQQAQQIMTVDETSIPVTPTPTVT